MLGCVSKFVVRQMRQQNAAKSYQYRAGATSGFQRVRGVLVVCIQFE